jgi:2-methylcitrate dehydratase PrpD
MNANATALEKLAGHLARGSGETPAAVRHAAALHVADTVAAWIASTRTPEGRALIAFRNSMRRRVAASENFLVDVATHCAMARLSEIDDIHLASMTTPGAIVVPATLTIAVALDKARPDSVLDAMLAGYEAMTRLGLAIDGPAVLYRGIWPSYFAAPFATAAVTARLLGLDAQQTAHALALALTFAAPGVGHHNPATTARWLAVGNAARNGITAALAAQSGLTSDVRMLEGPFLANVYGVTPNIPVLTEGLGAHPALPEVSFKPWCAARQTITATQALREIVQTGVGPETITAITAFVLPPHLTMIAHGVTAGDRASHLTSLPYQMAVAALTPEAAFDVGQTPAALAAPVAAFMSKINVIGEEKLLAQYPKAWPARVVVEALSGRHERTITHVPGDPARAFSDAEAREKFQRFVAPVLQDDGAEDALRLCLGVFADPEASALLLREVEDVYAEGALETG